MRFFKFKTVRTKFKISAENISRISNFCNVRYHLIYLQELVTFMQIHSLWSKIIESIDLKRLILRLSPKHWGFDLSVICSANKFNSITKRSLIFVTTQNILSERESTAHGSTISFANGEFKRKIESEQRSTSNFVGISEKGSSNSTQSAVSLNGFFSLVKVLSINKNRNNTPCDLCQSTQTAERRYIQFPFCRRGRRMTNDLFHLIREWFRRFRTCES